MSTDVRQHILGSVGVEGTPDASRWVAVDGWMFARGGHWHFFLANGLELLSLCRRHAFSGHQDLARDGYKSTAACVECRSAFWKLVKSGAIQRP